MQGFINSILGVLWSDWMIYLCLGAGLFFTLKSRFVQVRLLKNMFKLFRENETSSEGISSLQSFTLALSGRVGTGNIVGVVTAIAIGGPGAIFWMWMLAFLGAGTAFVESVLAQVYKEERLGQYRGGTAYYLAKGSGKKWVGYITAAIFGFSALVLMPGVQANAISEALYGAFNIPQAISGLFIIGFLGLIIIGGVKRIAKVAQFLLPFMTILYLGVAWQLSLLTSGSYPVSSA